MYLKAILSHDARARGHDARQRRLSAERLEDRLLLDARLVADINQTPLARGSYPQDFIQLNELVLFTAETSDGRELWRTDGTAAGTQQIVDLPTTPANSALSNFMVVDEYLYFQVVIEDRIGRLTDELWRSDGTTAGTARFYSEVVSDDLVVVDGELITGRQDRNSLVKITPDGTALRIVAAPGSAFTDPAELTVFGQSVFFTAETYMGPVSVSHGLEIWVSDLTRAGTQLLKDIVPGSDSSHPNHLFATAEALFFFATGADRTPQLWKTDGSSDSTVPVASLPITTTTDHQIQVASMTEANGLLYFVIDDSEHGQQLWRSDGTEGGTFLVKDIRDGSAGSGPIELFTFSDTLFFTADDGISGSELWTSDGTTAGTVLFKDIFDGPIGSGPGDFTVFDGQLFFSASDEAHGMELWKTDGTATGTVLAFDLIDGPTSSIPFNIRAAGNQLYFAAQGIPSEGFEPWRSDGTLADTISLGNLVVDGNDGSLPRAVTRVGETVYFSANDGVSGHELWKTNGTAGGTALVKDITPGLGSSDIGEMWNIDGTLYLSASDGIHGIELWTSDGTAEGTRLVKDIEPGFGGSAPADLIKVGNVIYFVAYDADHGEEIWKTDGTAEGTQLLKDINPGFAGSYPTDLTDVDGTLFFAADVEEGQEFWRSDGTAEGTVLATNLVLSPYSTIGPLVGMNDELFFVGGRLFKTAGTPESTVQLAIAQGIVEYGDNLLLIGSDGNRGAVIEYDPRQNEFPRFRDWVEIPLISEYDPQLTLMAGRLFFNASGPGAPGNADIELWSYDPRNDEIRPVVGDNVNATGSPEPKELSIHNDLIFFVATGDIGTEVWATNGTEVSTFPVADIAPGPPDSLPSQLTFLDNTLFVRADDGIAGTELWAIDLPPVVRFRDSAIDVVEGTGFVEGEVAITLTRLGNASSPLNVRIETVGGSATGSSAGTDHDFVDTPITVTFAANETETVVSLPFLRDDLRETDETIELAITNVNGGHIGAHFELTVNLVDDDYVPGDLDFDRDLDLADIDALVGAIVNDPPPDEFFFYDLNKDGLVNRTEIDSWLTLAGAANLPSQRPYSPGDANLDGMVDASDYDALNDHLFGTAPLWSMGDFNADGVIDGSDFNIWNDNKFTELGTAAPPNSRTPQAALARRVAIAFDGSNVKYTKTVSAIEQLARHGAHSDSISTVFNALLTGVTIRKQVVPRSLRGSDAAKIGNHLEIDELMTDVIDVEWAALVDVLLSSGVAPQRVA